MSASDPTRQFALAAAVVVAGIGCFDIMGAIIKHLSASYPTPLLSMLRNVFGFVPALVILASSRHWAETGRSFGLRQWKLALLRGGIGALAQLSFYFALRNLELATATTIAFAGPFFITALSIPVLGQKVGVVRWSAVLVGFAGIVMVMEPNAPDFGWAAVLPALAALGYAMISVTSRLFDAEVPTALITLYQGAGALAASFVIVALTGSFTPVVAVTDWLWFIAMGAAGGMGAFCLSFAYRRAEASSLAPFEYLAIPFSFGLGVVFFAEAPVNRLIPGVVFIIAAGLVTIWRERRVGARP